MTTATQNISGYDRFQALWRRCLIDGAVDDSAAIHQRLLNAYAEPQRRYHNLQHIEHCLVMLDLCRSLIDNPDALELALWFHDAIYEPGKSDNETLSAELYLDISAAVHPEQLREMIRRLIIATIHDCESLSDKDAQFMVDIDLSSFGLPWDEFLRDSLNLRMENPNISDSDYYKNQRNFQSCLLARKRFYQSEFFTRRSESQARDNLSKYLRHIQRSEPTQNTRSG